MTRGHVDPAQSGAVSRTMALRKVAQPDDVARQVVVLASDELSGHVTGQVVTVAGGMEGRVVHDDARLQNERNGEPELAASKLTSPQDDCRQSLGLGEPSSLSATCRAGTLTTLDEQEGPPPPGALLGEGGSRRQAPS